MNISFTSSDQFTAYKEKPHWMKTDPMERQPKFRTYNPEEVTKYELLLRMVCEAKSGYACYMEKCIM
jgi:hypothetical protein